MHASVEGLSCVWHKHIQVKNKRARCFFITTVHAIRDRLIQKG